MSIREETNKLNEQLRKNCVKLIEDEKVLQKKIIDTIPKLTDALHQLKKYALQIKETEQEIAKKKIIIEELNGKIKTKQSEYLALDINYNLLNQNKERLSKEFEVMKNSLSEITDKSEQKIKRLESDIIQLESTKKNLNHEIIKLTDEYEDLKIKLIDELQSLNTRKDEVSELIKKQKSESDRLTEERRILDEKEIKLNHWEKTLTDKDNLLNDKETQQKIRDKEQGDREISLDYKESKLIEDQEKFKKLVALNKMEGKL